MLFTYGKLLIVNAELMTSIGDNQSLLNSLKDSPYYKLFGDEARNWEIKLGLLDEYLQNLNQIQRRWVYPSNIILCQNYAF